MCPVLAYPGSPLIVNELLYEAKNARVNQSINAKETDEP